MSVRVMAAVFDMDLPPSEKLLLLSLADHADDSGGTIFPSVKRLALKSCVSERTVQRFLRAFVERGLLAKVREACQHRPTEYRIVRQSQGRQIGTPDDPGVDPGVTRNASRGDTAMAPEPSKEPSRDKADALSPAILISRQATLLSERLERRLLENGRPKHLVKSKSWPNTARLMTERDGRLVVEAEALIDWCQDHDFWKSVVLSMDSFRKHYDQMRLQAGADFAMRERLELQKGHTRSADDALTSWVTLMQRRLKEHANETTVDRVVRDFARKHNRTPSMEEAVEAIQALPNGASRGGSSGVS